MTSNTKTQLINGTKLQSSIGALTVKNFIAAGGQGEVYKLEINGKEYALKWYFLDKVPYELKDSLKILISKGSPSEKFLWPKAIVESNNNFGYIMDLRTKDFRGLQDLMLNKFDMEIRDLMTACIELTDSFQKLHAKGLSYQDVSFGNVFINPKNGNILICDNDNVTTSGQTVGSIIGTPKFMAPELVSGTVNYPDSKTDLFSEAILLFYMITRGHPFEGKIEAGIHCLDLPAQRGLYGEKAVFIFHPTNNTNRPIRQIHGDIDIIWNILPEFIKKLFIKTFTDGIVDFNSRTREVEWRKAFLQFRNNVYLCPHCGASEIIYNLEKVKTSGGKIICNHCKKEASVPRLKIEEYIICLNNNRKLTNEIILRVNSGDETEIATFNYDKNRLYITNNSNGNFTISNADGNVYDLTSGNIFRM